MVTKKKHAILQQWVNWATKCAKILFHTWLLIFFKLAFLTHFTNFYPRIDIIINNAAQTIRRPPNFYKHLIADEIMFHEQKQFSEHENEHKKWNAIKEVGNDPFQIRNSEGSQIVTGNFMENDKFIAALCTQVPLLAADSSPNDNHFPPGQLDEDGQQVDLRNENSWLKTISEISAVEMIEVQMVNNVAPFIVVSRLLPLMKNENFKEMKFVVNVSSVEGQFNTFKTAYHPHTNMAKAALNMMTHTCALKFSRERIYFNSVDTGWVSKMSPQPLQQKTRKPPLSSKDGAARVLDPIFTSIITHTPVWGEFWRNFRPEPW